MSDTLKSAVERLITLHQSGAPRSQTDAALKAVGRAGLHTERMAGAPYIALGNRGVLVALREISTWERDDLDGQFYLGAAVLEPTQVVPWLLAQFPVEIVEVQP